MSTMDPLKNSKTRTPVWLCRLQAMGILLVLAVLEIGPVPIAPFFGVYLVLWRPPWFGRWVADLYGEGLPAGRFPDKTPGQ